MEIFKKWILSIAVVFTACSKGKEEWVKGFQFPLSDTFISRGTVGQKVYNTMDDRVFSVIDTFSNGLCKVGRVNVSFTVDKRWDVSLNDRNFNWFGVINQDSQFVIPCRFEVIKLLNDTLFAVQDTRYSQNGN